MIFLNKGVLGSLRTLQAAGSNSYQIQQNLGGQGLGCSLAKAASLSLVAPMPCADVFEHCRV